VPGMRISADQTFRWAAASRCQSAVGTSSKLRTWSMQGFLIAMPSQHPAPKMASYRHIQTFSARSFRVSLRRVPQCRKQPRSKYPRCGGVAFSHSDLRRLMLADDVLCVIDKPPPAAVPSPGSTARPGKPWDKQKSLSIQPSPGAAGGTGMTGPFLSIHFRGDPKPGAIGACGPEGNLGRAATRGSGAFRIRARAHQGASCYFTRLPAIALGGVSARYDVPSRRTERQGAPGRRDPTERNEPGGVCKPPPGAAWPGAPPRAQACGTQATPARSHPT